MTEPLFRCRCSASGSQGQCAFGAETADAMQMHYLEQHGWATSAKRVVSLDVRYRAIAEQACDPRLCSQCAEAAALGVRF